MTHVVDSSALLAVILGERGGDQVFLPDRLLHISIVNLAEVYTKVMERGGIVEDAEAFVRSRPIRIRAFRQTDAIDQARLRLPTKSFGLSFGDRVCLSLARLSGLPVLTADLNWAKLDLDIDVQLIR